MSVLVLHAHGWSSGENRLPQKSAHHFAMTNIGAREFLVLAIRMHLFGSWGLRRQHTARTEQVECSPVIAVVTGCIALCIALAWVHKKRLCMRMMD
jgi:hypothetical protein